MKTSENPTQQSDAAAPARAASSKDSTRTLPQLAGVSVKTSTPKSKQADGHIAAEAHARLAAIVEGSFEPIIGNDLDGTIRTWNPAAERFFGYTVKEAIGQSITLIVPADLIAQEKKFLAAVAC